LEPWSEGEGGRKREKEEGRERGRFGRVVAS